MSKLPIVTIDFETEKIEDRPDYPPKPVGCAIREPGKAPYYLAWAHPTENNTTKAKAARIIKDHFRNSRCLFYNASFDIAVAMVHLGCPFPKQFEDAFLLTYLYDPRDDTLNLKDWSANHLNMPPDEQLELKDWIIKHVFGGKKDTKKNPWSAHIAKAPGKLVGKYAIGDVVRTWKAFLMTFKYAEDNGMLRSYEREKAVLPIFDAMSDGGIRVNVPRLKRDLKKWEAEYKELETKIRRKLKSKELDLKSGPQLAEALDRTGKVTDWVLTEKGNRSTSRDNLLLCCNDKILTHLLARHGLMSTYLQTFARNWLATAEKSGGYIFPTYNQVRSVDPETGKSKGTRTGRPSSTNPNLFNVPKDPYDEDKPWTKDLPALRNYLIPDEGTVFLNRDYCFSEDTEVLTNKGWKLFKDLDKTEKLAQWKDGCITYANPKAYQKFKFSGDMIHINGKDSCDLLVSPEHNCLQLNSNNKPVMIQAKDYNIGGFKQVVSGIRNNRSLSVDDYKLKLAVALQADAKVTYHEITHTFKAVFYLKKQRKLQRLKQILNYLEIDFKISDIPSKPDFKAIRFYCPDYLNEYYIDLKTKTFKRLLVDLPLENRRIFLKELGLWDGTVQNSNNWKYSNTNLANFDLIQEICVISGIRSKIIYEKTKGNRKLCKSISMVYKDSVYTKEFSKTVEGYIGYIYCVTMPHNTVIVRRNGKPCITGQCQQEIRILAHYEEGELLQAFLDNPDLDVHEMVGEMIARAVGYEYPRKFIKTLNFGTIYGMGAPGFSRKLGISIEEAKQLKADHGKALPGVKDLSRELKDQANDDLPIRTWGGRLYYVEEPKKVQGRLRTFEYKLLNYLIQGSAADCTKEAMIQVNDACDGRIVLQVYDELMICADKGKYRKEMALMREAMESVKFDLPMLSDGKIGRKSWGEAEAYKDPVLPR